jgi:hypothetical protein
MEFSESNSIEQKPICLYLGFTDDPSSHFSYPETAHRCFATRPTTSIELEHQSAFCFSGSCRACPRFVEPPSESLSVQPLASPVSESDQHSLARTSPGRTILWVMAGLLAGLVVIAGIFYFSNLAVLDNSVTPSVNQVTPTPTASLTAVPTPTEVVVETTPTSQPVAVLSTASLTPVPDGQLYTLSPAANDIGWLSNNEDKGNHFGDSYLYAGVFKDQVYISAFQFDLSTIPPGAPIASASLQLTGLRDDRLAIHLDRSDVAGTWALRLLDPEIGQNWRQHNFQNIFNAPVLQTLNPLLSAQDLAVGQTNIFELSSNQLKILETQIAKNEKPQISLRIEGPLVGPDNLFAWDTGYGSESNGNNVTLVLNVGPPPATPPVPDYIVVTSTPTPENVVTAAAIVMQITAEATRVGTATPVPSNVVTPTPIPDYLVVIPTPVPGNAATARALMIVATAEAVTTGTATPIPTDAVTATPTPTASPASPFDLADPSGPATYVLITSTPTPDTIFAAATLSAAATAEAQRIGTPTPLPENWITPVVVTATPTPMNAATAQSLAGLATAIAFTTGTPTATPPNMVTATPTPAFVSISHLLTPTPGAVLTPTLPIPSALLGKVLFKSDREGTQAIYIFDPKTGELGRLTDIWPYQVARERDAYSADTVYSTYTKQLLWTNIRTPLGNIPTTELAIHYYDFKYKEEKIVTKMGTGIVYDPVWSPIGNQIAFVATESGNDEIWIINYDGSDPRQLTRNTWEWDKSPSWSPDGKQIVFMSNRTGNQQLWLMNADGGDPKLLMGWDHWTPYNDSEPVWVKYLDPVPPVDQER